MDAFFAACEQQDRPNLRGRPVGVLPVMSRSTCCIAASYEAKAMGVKTGTPVWEAEKLCPGIRLIEARPAFYIQIHHKLLECTTQEAPIEKVYSIDEWSIRLSRDERPPGKAKDLAIRIKRRITEAFSDTLSSSIGIAPTRLLAKTASDLDKPNGITVITETDLPSAITHLKLTDLPGINTGIMKRLNTHRIHTATDLWRITRPQARAAWGSVEGERYWDGLHGVDNPEIETTKKSFSHANVLSPDLRNDQGAHAVITRLLHKAAARLRAHSYAAHRLNVSVRYAAPPHAPDLKPSWQDTCPLPACQDTQTILECFESLWHKRPPQTAPRKVGITLSHLTPAVCATGSLFESKPERQQLAAAMDKINKAHGGHAIYFGGMHAITDKDMPDKIAFGRVPDEKVRM